MDEVKRIKQLKKERNAIILAHNYQRGEVQDIADFVGDSFGLSQQAIDSGAEIIVFCGVDFMAERVAILNADKAAVMAETCAQCAMAAIRAARALKVEK